MAGHTRWLGAQCPEGPVKEPWRSARLRAVEEVGRRAWRLLATKPERADTQQGAGLTRLAAWADRAEVRAPRVAEKRGNSRRAKGRRKVDPRGLDSWTKHLPQGPTR